MDLGNEYISIKIEDMGKPSLLNNLSDWLGIQYDEILLKSTWAGLVWNADRVSSNKRVGTGFSKELLENNWEEKLSIKDKFILNFLMMDRLKHYNYTYSKRSEKIKGKSSLYKYLLLS